MISDCYADLQHFDPKLWQHLVNDFSLKQYKTVSLSITNTKWTVYKQYLAGQLASGDDVIKKNKNFTINHLKLGWLAPLNHILSMQKILSKKKKTNKTKIV